MKSSVLATALAGDAMAVELLAEAVRALARRLRSSGRTARRVVVVLEGGVAHKLGAACRARRGSGAQPLFLATSPARVVPAALSDLGRATLLADEKDRWGWISL